MGGWALVVRSLDLYGNTRCVMLLALEPLDTGKVKSNWCTKFSRSAMISGPTKRALALLLFALRLESPTSA